MSRLKRVVRSAPVRRVLAAVIAAYIRLVRATSRMDEAGPGLAHVLDRYTRGEPCIIAFWHGRLLLMPRLRPQLSMAHVLISRHGDGELIAAVLTRLGLNAVRGSTSRGGATAMRELYAVLERDGIVAVTPDGPRGPRMRAAAGVIVLARHAQVPIYPLAYATRRGWLLKSWDRLLLPSPFNRGVFLAGDPIWIPADADDEAVERARHGLEAALNDLTREADIRAGRQPVRPAEAFRP